MITEAARICVIETIDDGEMTATTADAHTDNQKQQAGVACYHGVLDESSVLKDRVVVADTSDYDARLPRRTVKQIAPAG